MRFTNAHRVEVEVGANGHVGAPPSGQKRRRLFVRGMDNAERQNNVNYYATFAYFVHTKVIQVLQFFDSLRRMLSGGKLPGRR
jgi:hypothetical protein